MAKESTTEGHKARFRGLHLKQGQSILRCHDSANDSRSIHRRLWLSCRTPLLLLLLGRWLTSHLLCLLEGLQTQRLPCLRLLKLYLSGLEAALMTWRTEGSLTAFAGGF